MSSLQLFLVGAFGAFLQEILWWYNARHSLDEERYARLVKSPGYWVVTVLFILATGGMIVIWFWGEVPPGARTVLLTGGATPLLIKQGLKALTPPQNFGTAKFSLRDYLQ